jgi:hypothetical protein
VGGPLRPSDEVLEAAFVDPARIRDWHADHGGRVSAALRHDHVTVGVNGVHTYTRHRLNTRSPAAPVWPERNV